MYGDCDVYGVNPYMYEYVLDRAWERNCTDQEWIRNLADRRAGVEDENYRKAWSVMYEKVLKDISGNRSALLPGRPAMNGTSKWSKVWTTYSNKDLLEVWKYLAQSDRHDTPSWKFDCVNIPRQCLENAFGRLNDSMLKAYKAGDAEKVDELCSLMSQILDDVDRLVSADSYFLLGKWIGDARALGCDAVEADYYERDARNIITTWGGRGQKLNDYANRTYAGLLADGTLVDEQALLDAMLDHEWEWVSRTDSYSPIPVGDPALLCSELYEKWNEVISKL